MILAYIQTFWSGILKINLHINSVKVQKLRSDNRTGITGKEDALNTGHPPWAMGIFAIHAAQVGLI